MIFSQKLVLFYITEALFFVSVSGLYHDNMIFSQKLVLFYIITEALFFVCTVWAAIYEVSDRVSIMVLLCAFLCPKLNISSVIVPLPVAI